MRNVREISPAVRATGLTRSYGPKTVFTGLSFEILRGERCCLVGGNGSGKTTLLEVLAGLKTPSGGSVEVLGRAPSDPKLKGHRALLMDRASFPYYARVREVVWLYASFYAHSIDVAERLAIFELDGGSFVRHLSKGQRQRLGLLLALLGDPALILLDEPTSGLDPQARLKLWSGLERKLREDPGATLFFSSHDLMEAEQRADRVAILHQGRLIAFAPPQELWRSVIGTRRKLTLVGRPALEADRLRNEGVGAIAHLGAETALYTDQPERVLQKLALVGDSIEIRIENVSLRDAFFKLTGEVPDESPAVALQKLG